MKLPIELPSRWKKQTGRVFNLVRAHPTVFLAGTTLTLFAILLVQSQGADETRSIFKREGVPDFRNASILGNPGAQILRGEERQFSKNQRTYLEGQTQLKSEIQALRSEVERLKALPLPMPIGSPSPGASVAEYGPQPLPSPLPMATTRVQDIRLSAPPEQYGRTRISDQVHSTAAVPVSPGLGFSNFGNGARRQKLGSSMISFPVKSTGIAFLKKPSIVLPSGSYVKAKLLTGVEAPEGKTYPVLLQLDFAYVIPNDRRLDLSGCFMIAKAQGDLSTERVQMQASKLSCVSKRGGMFEREVNGFVADDADNSFAVMGSVNSKQDRVASTAFLSSIVSGIGKAIQQAQTTSQATPLGGGQSIVTGDQAKYIGAGGASEAATMVTQWYLKQAQNLLPTINIGSGQAVWVIMQDQVDLPKDYFNQNSSGGTANASIYSYFTRLSD